MKRIREDDSTFELNLAPMLDIIVSIVPMLLLSVAFTQIAVIDTPVPQAVKKAMEQSEKKNEVQISLDVSSEKGFRIQVTQDGHVKETMVNLKNNELDLAGLHHEVVAIKQQYPNSFRMELHPDDSIPLDKLVGVMDQLRTRAKEDPKLYFTDTQSGKNMETDLLFPDVVFGNVAGG